MDDSVVVGGCVGPWVGVPWVPSEVPVVLQGGRDVRGTVASLGASAAALAYRAEDPAEAREAPDRASASAPVDHLGVPCDLAEGRRTAGAVVA